MTKKKVSVQLGRPDEGISQRKVDLRMPADLAHLMQRQAAVQEVSVSEVWRQAARQFLGIEEEQEQEQA